MFVQLGSSTHLTKVEASEPIGPNFKRLNGLDLAPK
jgi:hypothetical protein